MIPVMLTQSSPGHRQLQKDRGGVTAGTNTRPKGSIDMGVTGSWVRSGFLKSFTGIELANDLG